MPKKWERDAQRKRHNEHLQRIRDMQPSVDDKAPKKPPKDNRKQIERERVLAVVERDNRLLLDRLGKAMESKNIDNFLAPVKFTSVQEENRKKILRRVTADNLRLLNRIQNVEPMYRAIEWERDAEQREKYLATMTEFPDRYVPKYSPSRQMQRAQNKATRAISPVGGAAAGGTAASPYPQSQFPGMLMMNPVLGDHPPGQRDHRDAIMGTMGMTSNNNNNYGNSFGANNMSAFSRPQSLNLQPQYQQQMQNNYNGELGGIITSSSPLIRPPEGDGLMNGIKRPISSQNLRYGHSSNIPDGQY